MALQLVMLGLEGMKAGDKLINVKYGLRLFKIEMSLVFLILCLRITLIIIHPIKS
jgi:hypothetical protein